MNKGLIGGLVALGLIGVTAGVCVGVPQIRNEIVGIYHDVEDKVNDTDLKNEISNLESKLNELKEKYNSSLENFNLLKLEKENLENQIEEIQANNELTLSEKNALISSLNEQLEEKNSQIETLTTQNSEYLLEIQELEEELEKFEIQTLWNYVVTDNVMDFLSNIYFKKPLLINGQSYSNVGFKTEFDMNSFNNYLVLGYYEDINNFKSLGIISNSQYAPAKLYGSENATIDINGKRIIQFSPELHDIETGDTICNLGLEFRLIDGNLDYFRSYSGSLSIEDIGNISELS